MSAAGKIDFGGEMSKMLPVIMKKATSSQMVLLSKEGLTFPQVIILDLLREKSPSKMGEIAKALNLTMSAATGIIDKMIEMKLVSRERSKDDRRIVLVDLAKKGDELAREINEGRRRSANELFSALEESEKQEYLRLLRKIYDSIKREG